MREADLVQDEALLISTFNDNRGQRSDRRRFRWLYRENPIGLAKAWLAIDVGSGEVAGSAAAFPRLMALEGRDVMGWNCGDLSVNASYRGRGVAVMLRQAAKRGVDDGLVPFFYSHPNDRARSVHLKAGYRPLGDLLRCARLFREDGRHGRLFELQARYYR